MNKLITSIFNSKNLLIFAVLFFIAGLLVPAISHGQAGAGIDAGSIHYGAGESTDKRGWIPGIGTLTDITLKGMAEIIGRAIVWIAYQIMDIGKWLLDNVLNSEFLRKPITKDPTVVLGWTIVRDLSNMFIVLGFMVVAIATILRLREYEAQKLLLPLIIIALLINFSLLICGVVIDGANITMSYFLSGAISVGGGLVTTPFTEAVRNDVAYYSINASLEGNSGSYGKFFALITSISLYAFIAAMLFVIYAFLFIFRYVALMCLAILSPLAFICFVFPRTKAIYEKWLSQFVQWAIVGIPATFFIYLASNIMGTSYKVENVINGNLISFFVPAAFLYFAYTLTFQISAIGAAGAIGLAMGAMRFARGATGKIAGGTLRMAGAATGATRIGQALSDKVIGIGERLGLASRGARANRVQERLDAGKKRMAFEKDETLLAVARKGNKAWTPEERENAAAATEALMKKGKGHLLGDDLEKSLLHAKSFGANIGEMSKGEYRVAGMDQKAIDRLVATRGLTPAQAKFELEHQHIEDNIHSMTGEQRRNIDPSHLNADLLTGKSMTINIVKNFRTAEDPQLAKFGTRANPAAGIAAALDPAVAAKFTADIAAAAGDAREQKRLRDLRSEILKLLS